MTCKLCGTEIKENETVCSLCGTAVENVSAPEVEEAPAPAEDEEKTAPATVSPVVIEENKPAPAAEESKFVCTGCSKEYAVGTKFCAECGGKVEEKKPVAVEEDTAPKFVCTGCSKEYPAGTKFCAECGGKVEEVKPAAPEVFACVGCGKEYAAGTKFCGECGGKVEKVKPAVPEVFACIGCGKEYPVGTKFCTECGGKVGKKSAVANSDSDMCDDSEQETLFDIFLVSTENKVATIKEVRSITGAGLVAAKNMVETIPACLKKNCTASEVQKIKTMLLAVGAKVDAKVHAKKK